METLVVVPHHRNHHYYGSRNSCSHVHDRFGSPTGGFRDINCRFQANREGILSTPLKYKKIQAQSSSPPKTPTCNVKKDTPILKTPNLVGSHSEGGSSGRSKAIPIKGNNLEKSFSEDLSYSELWAGPAYCNSPPPSSLPIPKFSMRQKRSVSLELPVRELGIKLHPVAKSAPSSPRGGSCPSPHSFLRSTASAVATKDLRRILNLDVANE